MKCSICERGRAAYPLYANGSMSSAFNPRTLCIDCYSRYALDVNERAAFAWLTQ